MSIFPDRSGQSFSSKNTLPIGLPSLPEESRHHSQQRDCSFFLSLPFISFNEESPVLFFSALRAFIPHDPPDPTLDHRLGRSSVGSLVHADLFSDAPTVEAAHLCLSLPRAFSHFTISWPLSTPFYLVARNFRSLG